MRLRAAGLSDVGEVRSSNQDAFAVLLAPDVPPSVDGVLVVADGMGGHRGGAIASWMAVAAIKEHFGATPDPGQRPALLAAVKQALEDANRHVYQRSLNDPELRGMGTTCTLTVLSGSTLYVAHVGDSRAYLLRNGLSTALTRDHSWVANEVLLGNLTLAEAAHHPRKNVLLRAVGAHPEVEIDVSTSEIRPGDGVLLCSDGLTNVMEAAEFAAAMETSGDPERLCAHFVRTAKQRGAPDNVTVVVGVVLEELVL